MESMDRAETEEDDESSLLTKRRVNFDEKSDDELEASTFETYLVIEFADNVSSKSLHWIVDKIRGKKNHGGAELLLRKEPNSEYVEVKIFLFVVTKTIFFLLLSIA